MKKMKINSCNLLMKVNSIQVSLTTLQTSTIISMTKDSIRSRECNMIQKSSSKLSINLIMIIQLKMRKTKEMSKKLRLHNKFITMGTHPLIIIIRSHFNSFNTNNSLHRLSTSIRSQPCSISIKLIQVQATFHKVEWSMEGEVQAPISALTSRGSEPSHRLQGMC